MIKDPGPAKAADNFYFLGDGIVAAWAVDTSDGIILIDTLNNQEEVDKFIIGGLRSWAWTRRASRPSSSAMAMAIIMAGRI